VRGSVAARLLEEYMLARRHRERGTKRSSQLILATGAGQPDEKGSEC
jgi:hypothetical protein